MVRVSSLSAVVLSFLIACGGKAPDPQPAANPPATKEEPKKDPPPKEDPKPEPATKEDPKPAADVGEAPADSGGGSIPGTPDKPTQLVTATPGTVVKNPVPDSPEWLIMQVLAAAMEPDEQKGWDLFVSLLHEDQKLENALASRRQLNFAASRRKVKLFLYEDPTKPIYRVDRVVEETPTQVRIYVHNNSEGSMPTPCELRMDENLKKWRVGICSL